MLNRDNPNIGRVTCPYLGQQDDPSTSLAFPSPWNYCHKVKPVESVSADHQRVHCLTMQYVSCPIFERKEAIRLPRGLRWDGTVGFFRPKVAGWTLAISLLILLALFLIVRFERWGRMLSIPKPPQAVVTESQATSTIVTLDPQPVAQLPLFFLESTPTFMLPEWTAFPAASPTPQPAEATATATPIPPHCGTALEAIVNGEQQFFIHKIQGGESLNTFADRYQTSLAAIQAVNYRLPVPLRENWVVAIPMDFTNVDGLPTFEVEQISQADMTLEEMAYRLGADPFLLARFNGLDPSCTDFDGWFLVPRVMLPTPAGP